MRLKIVIQDAPWLTRAKSPSTMEVLDLLCKYARRGRQMLCGVRGHHYVLKMHRRRLALHCQACGYTTAGWDLSDPTPKVPSSDRPRFLELLRKRS